MSRLGLVLCLAAFLAARTDAQLPCDSYFRSLFPEYFSHCTPCTYGDWSEWEIVPDSTVSVPVSQCSSGEAYREIRTQTAAEAGCGSKTETRPVCMPSQEDRLIMQFDLGGGGQDHSSTGGGNPGSIHVVPFCLNCKPKPALPRLPQCRQDERICQNSVYRGKRSIRRERRVRDPVKRKHNRETEPVFALDITPIEFNWEEHHMRFRRTSHCQPNGIQYMLFLLDTSGSIGRTDFQRMTSAISKLVGLFCKPTKFAVMTFNHEFNLEFCFNCHENTCDGRKMAEKAIRSITYRGGSTYTAGATKCANDNLLSDSCGLDSEANCISVVYITDGHSNDPNPNLEVCREINLLRNRFGSGRIRTFAFGIDNYDEDEIQCIGQSSDTNSVFRFESFDDFETSLNNLIGIVNDVNNPVLRVCHNHEGTLTLDECS